MYFEFEHVPVQLVKCWLGCAWSAGAENEWTPDSIVIVTVLVGVVVVTAAVVVVIVWLLRVYRKKNSTADPVKNKLESARLVSPPTNETLLDMIIDGTGSGSGLPLQLVNCFCSVSVKGATCLP